MYQYYEICPKCQCEQKMAISISFKKMANLGDKEEYTLYYNYHCEVCNTFVKSGRYDEVGSAGHMEQAASFAKFYY